MSDKNEESGGVRRRRSIKRLLRSLTADKLQTPGLWSSSSSSVCVLQRRATVVPIHGVMGEIPADHQALIVDDVLG